MNIEKYHYHCSQCGAPLVRKRGKVSCEYCGQIYFSVSPDREEETMEESVETPAPQTDEQEDYPQRSSQVQAPGKTYDPYKYPTVQTPISMKNIVMFFIFVFILALVLCNYPTKPKSGGKTRVNTSTSTSPVSQEFILTKAAALKIKQQATEAARNRKAEEPFIIHLILEDFYDFVAYPTATNEDLPVATAMVLEYADANKLIFSLFVHNQSENDIDTSSLQEHLEINSLAVTSDMDDLFTCSLQKENWKKQIFLKGHIQRKAMITCDGSLNSESSSILIDFDMPNWGSSHLVIPIQADNENLRSSIKLKLANESYSISAELHSEQPQLVWVKKSDILISDDRGITLSVDGCTPSASQQGAGEYFLTLAYPSAYDEKTYDGNFITCEYEEPFPSEINTMNASLKATSGKIFTSQAVINKSDGLIIFDEQSIE